jgi:hypothetical protein
MTLVNIIKDFCIPKGFGKSSMPPETFLALRNGAEWPPADFKFGCSSIASVFNLHYLCGRGILCYVLISNVGRCIVRRIVGSGFSPFGTFVHSLLCMQYFGIFVIHRFLVVNVPTCVKNIKSNNTKFTQK